jgi:hypothetical protein
MTNNPFNPRPPKQINPRFSLGGSGNGTETEDFSPKSSVPERLKRPAPRPIGEQVDTPAPSFPEPSAAPRVSPNSMFAGEENDDLNLDLGVNENESELRPASKAVPVVKSQPAVQAPVVRQDTPVVPAPKPVIQVEEDDINLDVGVNDKVEEPSEAYVPPVVTPVVPAAPVAVVTKAEPVVEEFDEEEEESTPTPVQEAIVAPPVRKVAEVKKEKPARSVNPLFADPTPEVEDSDDINLDVGVNDASAAPVKRQINSLFDFKNDKQANRKDDPDRLPGWKKPGPLMDTSDGEEFKKEKNKRSSKKNQNTGRRGFQIQERDITLLRFLTKYQFSYVDAIARVLNSTPQSINNRLRTLEEYDLVKRQVIAAGSTLWQTRKAGIELSGMAFTENKKVIPLGTIRHTIGLVNLAAELEREADDSKDILGLAEKFGEPFPVMNRWPGGIRLYGEEALESDLTYGEMTIAEREIRQGQKRYRGGRSSAEMRDLVDFSILNPEGPELEEGNEGLFVVYGTGGKTGEHVPDLVVTRPRNEDGTPNHFAVELELTPKSPSDWKRILRSYRDAGGMYSRLYYFTPDKPIANMIRNADKEVGLGDKLIIRKYTPKNKRQPFLG